MRRRDSVWFVLAMGAVTNLVAACPPPPPSPQKEVALLFDPTVRETADSTAIRDVLGQFGSFFANAPPEARLWVGVVAPGAANDPMADTTFRMGTEYGADQKRRQEIHAWADMLSDSLFLRWKIAHGEEEFRRPQSCLGSSLYFLNNQVKPSSAAHVVIVSDMVEACPESGVNLERQPPSGNVTQRLVAAMGMVDFSGYCSVTIVWIGHARYQAPRRIDSLETFWDGLLEEIGAAAVRHERSLASSLVNPLGGLRSAVCPSASGPSTSN